MHPALMGSLGESISRLVLLIHSGEKRQLQALFTSKKLARSVL